MPLSRRPGDVTQKAAFIMKLSTGEITREDIDALTPERRREIATIDSKAAQKKAPTLVT